MDRAFASGTAGTPPAAPASPSIGYPTAGNPASAVPATKPGAHWYHMITEEIRAVIVAAGITPDHEDLTQLSQAIGLLANIEFASDAEAQALTSSVKAISPATLASAFKGGNQSLASNGYQKLPGGLIVQWGSVSVNVNVANAYVNQSFSWPITFPNAVLRSFGDGLVQSNGYTNIEVTSQTESGAVMRVASSAAIGAGSYNYFAIGY